MMSFSRVLVAALAAASGARAAQVILSNVALPLDQHGEKIITGEADVLLKDGVYYMYFNNWGDCPGVNCCSDPAGCATCCFKTFKHYLPGCGDFNNGSDPYGLYHTVQAYSTKDFKTWTNLGVALSLKDRLPGTEFRPHVLYNKKTKLFNMWFEDRGYNLHGYAIAQSAAPGGPFVTKFYNVSLPGKGRTGDYDVFVDDDGSAYHIRTGFDVVKLNDDYTGAATDKAESSFTTPKGSEGPVVFKRKGIYYVMAGTGCCACIGGSTIYVMMAPSMKGPWTYAGDVGSNPTKFDPHSPNNYVTKAQASSVAKVGSQYLWMGNQWNSGLSETPPGPRKHDLLYWSILDFNANGTVKQFEYQKTIEFDGPV